nr:sigma-54-dependent Fis family transcriptional regulator [Bacteroidota bacterium]
MQKTEARILIVDDDLDVLVSAQMFLKQLYTVVQVSPRPANIPHLLEEQRFDVVLLDMNFNKGKNDGTEGIYWLNKILDIDPATVVIFITAFGGVDLAVKSIKNGAFDFIEKPWKNDKLLGIIHAALQLRKSKSETEKYKSRHDLLKRDLNSHFSEIIGQSLAMKKVFDVVEKVAKTDAEVLILGENGTGKEMIAREIHRLSDRDEEPFVKIDLGSIHENLFESELFGHVKGAFTGAEENRVGRMEVATGGTLFLDEIGNLTPSMQVKLLSAIQNRKIVRIGSNQEIPIDIHLVCATNMSLYDMVPKREFREDLLYRINTVEIRIPPLRERTGDIPLLLEYFLGLYQNKYKKKPFRVTKSTLTQLEKYPWPGNVRELQHAVERAVILSDGNSLNFMNFATGNTYQSQAYSNEDDLNINEMEKRLILRAISRNKGNITRAAADLGIARTALYRRLEKHDI